MLTHTEHYCIKNQRSYECKKCRSNTYLKSGTINKFLIDSF